MIHPGFVYLKMSYIHHPSTRSVLSVYLIFTRAPFLLVDQVSDVDKTKKSKGLVVDLCLLLIENDGKNWVGTRVLPCFTMFYHAFRWTLSSTIANDGKNRQTQPPPCSATSHLEAPWVTEKRPISPDESRAHSIFLTPQYQGDPIVSASNGWL